MELTPFEAGILLCFLLFVLVALGLAGDAIDGRTGWRDPRGDAKRRNQAWRIR